MLIFVLVFVRLSLLYIIIPREIDKLKLYLQKVILFTKLGCIFFIFQLMIFLTYMSNDKTKETHHRPTIMNPLF